jgi:adenine deaminase
MVDSLEECRVKKVWKRGTLVAEDGSALFRTFAPMSADLPVTGALDASPPVESYGMPARPGRDIRVIGALPRQVLTKQMIFPPAERDGFVVSDCERDILKAAVIEKNRGTGRMALVSSTDLA